MATEKMPMTAKAIADMAAKTRQVDRSQPVRLVVPSTTVADSRLTWA